MSNRFEEALAASDEMARRFGDSEVLSVQVTVAKALADKVTVFYKLHRLEEALAASDEMARRFGDSEVLSVQVTVAKALADKVTVFYELKSSGRSAGSIRRDGAPLRGQRGAVRSGNSREGSR